MWGSSITRMLNLSLIFCLLVITGTWAGIPGVDVFVQQLANADFTNYPTSFTRDIIPKGIHSHNDYWRDVPLYSALSYGVISVEADVWLINGTLYVGHELESLTPNRTFDGMYVQPLVDILNLQNPITPFTTGMNVGPVGVFDRDGTQTLYLFVDVKTDGPTTWPAVVSALQPLRDNGWLSRVNGANIRKGPITVVGTGNTPLYQLIDTPIRDVFFDAPLGNLNSSFTPALSPIASGDYEALVGWDGKTPVNDAILEKISAPIQQAHSAGLMTRFWDTPLYPIFARNAVWMALLEQESDILNADDLQAAAAF